MLLTVLVCYWLWARTCIAQQSTEHWISNPQPPLKVSCLVWGGEVVFLLFGFTLAFFSVYSTCRAASELEELPFPCWRSFPAHPFLHVLHSLHYLSSTTQRLLWDCRTSFQFTARNAFIPSYAELISWQSAELAAGICPAWTANRVNCKVWP